MDGELSPNEKAKIASNLLMLAPPCQFNEVFTDVRNLIGDDNLLKEKVAPTFGQYNKDQFIPAKLPDKPYKVLITKYNDIGNGKYFDSRGCTTFKFDHLKRTASDVSSSDVENKELEPLRKAVESLALEYVEQHYRSGICSVFSKTLDGIPCIIICIQSHYNKNYTSGRWRSEWIIPYKKSSDNSNIDVKGVIKIQTHMYEEGNVQMLTSKELRFSVNFSSNLDALAKELLEKVHKSESNLQEAIGDNLKNMSNTTFKSLRRQLPITQNKIDWNKIHNYKVGNEMFHS